jgi:hypothetical protein
MKWPRILVAIFALTLTASFLGGCGSADKAPGHTAEEQKLVDELNNQTPEEQIERIQKGPMPQAAKDEMIKKIKQENGIK